MTPTPEQITAAARALADHNADVCNVNREDNWMIYGDSFRESAEIALRAAAGTTADAAAIAGREAFKLLAALVDIYDDGMNNAPEDRCYVEGAWKETLDEARAYVAARAALATTEATDAIAPTEGAKPDIEHMVDDLLFDERNGHDIDSSRAAIIDAFNPAPSVAVALTNGQRKAIEWAIGMASQHNIHKSPLRALLAHPAPSPEAPAVDALTTGAVAWNYCPECGCEDYERTGYDNGRFCADCGQEWFPDIDYTSVVRRHLSERAAHPASEPVALTVLAELSKWAEGMTRWADEPKGPYLRDIISNARALLADRGSEGKPAAAPAGLTSDSRDCQRARWNGRIDYGMGYPCPICTVCGVRKGAPCKAVDADYRSGD